MTIPIKKSLLKIRRGKPQWLILHHTVCQMFDPQNYLDTKLPQIGRDRYFNVVIDKKIDLNFHFILERIDKDYEIIFGRPVIAECNFDDIPQVYYRSIHIALLGDYNIQNCDVRLYNVLAYRLIVPLMRTFGISIDRVVTHKSISTDKKCTCPGNSFVIEILKAKIKEFWMK